MERLTALFAGWIEMLRAAATVNLCPGSWPWAVTAFGVFVGLLPTAGAVTIALARRRIGSRYGFPEGLFLVGVGLVSAGLLPLIVFSATGQFFSAVADGAEVSGLSRASLAELGAQTCVGPTQAEYLGGLTVTQAFSGDPVVVTLAGVTLGAVPVFATLFVAAQARLALRRGPAWPSKFFWLSTLALIGLTTQTPAFSTGHLWLGFAAGSFVGILVLLLVGAPSRERVRKLAEAGVPGPRNRAANPRGRPAGARPAANRARVSGREQRRDAADRLAERFAGPPVVAPASPPRGAPPVATATARNGRPQPHPQPTRLAPGPPFAGVGGAPGAARFRLLRRLGSGGFGRVWLADDARLGHRVALKSAHAPDAETEERIQREARALAAVRHPHCVRILDMLPATSDPGLAELDGMVLVMEFVDGPSLAELIRTQGLVDDLAAARVWIGVAGALDAAHARGVMHRDVKPGNIVIDSGGLAHLIDFGIARKTGDATLTATGFVLGAPDFLAPEVACGEPATPSSDSWQLAATVSYALTGHPPRGAHADAVSGLRAAAAGARLSHLPMRSAHLGLLRAALDSDPMRRPPLHIVQRTLEDHLHRTGARPDGPVTAGRAR